MGYDAWLLLFNAYEFIKLGVPAGLSNTARLLRDPDWPLLRHRLADELRELAGVLDGTHLHQGLPYDLILEGSQVCYWAFVCAHAAGTTMQEIRPSSTNEISTGGAIPADHLRDLAVQVGTSDDAPPSPLELRACWHLVLAACILNGIDTATPALYDLEQMRARSYMQPYFTLQDATRM